MERKLRLETITSSFSITARTKDRESPWRVIAERSLYKEQSKDSEIRIFTGSMVGA
jgi:hypothetical protein